MKRCMKNMITKIEYITEANVKDGFVQLLNRITNASILFHIRVKVMYKSSKSAGYLVFECRKS
jgi:hypothetical protein